MKGKFLLLTLIILIFSCNIRPGGDRATTSPDKIFQIKINPQAGTNYDYDVSNETDTRFEVNDNTIQNQSNTRYVVNYAIQKDTTGNFDIGINYKKIHIHSKINGQESDLDAGNSPSSTNPIENLLGALTRAKIKAIVNRSGKLIEVQGYKEIASNYFANTNLDLNSKLAAEKQWQDLVEKTLVKANIQRLFQILPDSAIHIGDRWKTQYKEDGDLNFVVKNSSTLVSIDDGIAAIKSTGRIETDSSATSIMGFPMNSDLKGNQEGNYEMNIKSGMLEDGKITTKINGSLEVLGRQIPLTIDIKIKIEGTENK
ncbi:MAG: DUF6263 family protein [Ginsengibacter sp.]